MKCSHWNTPNHALLAHFAFSCPHLAGWGGKLEARKRLRYERFIGNSNELEMNSNNPNDGVSREEVNVPNCSLCHAVVPWEGPLCSIPRKWPEVVQSNLQSQSYPSWLLQKLTLSWLKPGQSAYLFTKGGDGIFHRTTSRLRWCYISMCFMGNFML